VPDRIDLTATRDPGWRHHNSSLLKSYLSFPVIERIPIREIQPYLDLPPRAAK